MQAQERRILSKDGVGDAVRFFRDWRNSRRFERHWWTPSSGEFSQSRYQVFTLPHRQGTPPFSPTPLRQRYPYTPQTKGKVERTVAVLKSGFWPGVAFTDLDDLNTQVLAWCDRLNAQPHASTHVPPLVRLAEEGLRPLPTGWAWERFASEERRVSWDGYLSYDGVLYGLPAAVAGLPSLAGTTVQVRERAGQVLVWSSGQCVLEVAKRARSRTLVPHPDQFRGVASAAAAARRTQPLGHQIVAPQVAQRDLREYDWLYGVALGAEEGPQ